MTKTFYGSLLAVSGLALLLAFGSFSHAAASDLRLGVQQGGETVIASWYGARYRGKPTASGEPFDPGAMTAAHPTLPFGTMVEVHYPARGTAVVVRINDRGPHARLGRGIDLSEAAARSLGLVNAGVGEVVVVPVSELAYGW